MITLYVRSPHVFQKLSNPVMMLIIYNRNLPCVETGEADRDGEAISAFRDNKPSSL